MPVPAYVEEWEANSPSNLASSVTPLARQSSAPAEVSAQRCTGVEQEQTIEARAQFAARIGRGARVESEREADAGRTSRELSERVANHPGRISSALELLVALAVIAAPLLDPFQAPVRIGGLVRVVLIEASVQPGLSRRLA